MPDRYFTWITASVVEMYPSGSGLSRSVRLAVISRVTWESRRKRSCLLQIVVVLIMLVKKT